MAGSEDAASFEARMANVVRDGAITLGLTMGVELGFFKAMVEFEDCFTAEELAEKTNCKKLFVKEWLLMMAASDVVELIDDKEDKFHLPNHRREGVTSATSAIESRCRFIVNYASNAYELMEVVKVGGPEKMSSSIIERRKADRHRSLGGQTPGTIQQVPGLAALLESGCTVLDVGSNRGDLLLFMGKKYPKSTFVGIDVAKADIEKAIQAAKDQGLANVSFHLEDALQLPADWTDKFDWVIAVNTLHHLPDGMKGASEMKRVLKPGSYLSVVEIKKDERVRENMKQPGAPMFHLFNMTATASGHRHDHHHGHSHHGHGHHDKSNMATGQGETMGGHHGKNTFQNFTHQLKEVGFPNVKMVDASPADFLDQIHFICQK